MTVSWQLSGLSTVKVVKISFQKLFMEIPNMLLCYHCKIIEMVMNKKTYFFPEQQQSTFNIWCYQQLQTHGGSTIDVSAVMQNVI